MRNKDDLYSACQELVRELCRLVDSGVSIDSGKFHKLCGEERFIDHLFLEHGDVLRLEYLDKNSLISKPEIIQHIISAMSRQTNAIVMEDFGLKNNAYLLAVNLTFEILEESRSEN